MGRSALRLRRIEGRRQGDGSRDHRLLPRPDVRLQDAEGRRVRADSEDLDREDSKIHAAQSGGRDEGDFGVAVSTVIASQRAAIQVLQGPSATAIYGSRGTNGVILITTKRGKAGDFKINYSYQNNLQTPPDHLDVMNLQQYASMVKQYHTIAGGTTPGEFLDSSLLGEGTDWQKELFNNAAMNKHQLNLSGGSNNTTYYLSGEYLDQDGVAEGSGFQKIWYKIKPG